MNAGYNTQEFSEFMEQNRGENSPNFLNRKRNRREQLDPR